MVFPQREFDGMGALVLGMGEYDKIEDRFINRYGVLFDKYDDCLNTIMRSRSLFGKQLTVSGTSYEGDWIAARGVVNALNSYPQKKARQSKKVYHYLQDNFKFTLSLEAEVALTKHAPGLLKKLIN